MIIVLFHVFYLFGQYIYKNYCIKRPRALCDAAKDTESSSELQNYEMFSDNLSWDDDDDEKPPTSKYREIKGLKFDPPAYIQRYSAVQDILNDPMYKGQIRKVLMRIYTSCYHNTNISIDIKFKGIIVNIV